MRPCHERPHVLHKSCDNHIVTFPRAQATGRVPLLEVLLAIVIFVIGLLALAHLQTNLTRSSTDANTRTVAANVGEELLERLRAFRRVSTDPDGALFAFADIDDAYVNQTIQRGGVNYTVTADVKGYNFNDDRTAVTETDPAVAGTVYDFKVVDLVIAWDSSQSFQIDNEGASVTNTAMGSGNIEISGLIPSIPSLGAAKVAAEDDGELGYVPVDYTPEVFALKQINCRIPRNQESRDILDAGKSIFGSTVFNGKIQAN